MPTVEVTVFQKNIKMGLNPLLQAKLGSDKSQFLVFPEYFFADSSINDPKAALSASEQGLNWLLELSQSYKGVIVGGSVVTEKGGNLYNSTPIISGGAVVDYYHKRNLTDGEKKHLTPGTEPGVFHLAGTRFGVMICADVLIEEHWQQMADQNIHLVFVPVTSPHLPNDTDETRATRDNEIFIERCKKYNLSVVKCGAVGELFGNPLQGRSLISTPDGISWRMAPSEWNKEISKKCNVVFPRANV